MNALNVFSPALWLGYLNQAARGLMLAVPVAVLFELGGWLARSYVLKKLAPTLGRDQARDPASRARRRRQLRDYTTTFLRWLQTTAALVVIFTLWRLDAVAVALVLVALVVVARPLLSDAVSSWSLLLDDALAPGDQVEINGTLRGTVTECGLRRIRLTDDAGRTWWIRCSDIGSILTASTSREGTGSHE